MALLAVVWKMFVFQQTFLHLSAAQYCSGDDPTRQHMHTSVALASQEPLFHEMSQWLCSAAYDNVTDKSNHVT